MIKSHGSADIAAFTNAIKEAVLEVKKDIPQRIGKQLESFLIERRAV